MFMTTVIKCLSLNIDILSANMRCHNKDIPNNVIFALKMS